MFVVCEISWQRDGTESSVATGIKSLSGRRQGDIPGKIWQPTELYVLKLP